MSFFLVLIYKLNKYKYKYKENNKKAKYIKKSQF